jgi:hypothetical protein
VTEPSPGGLHLIHEHNRSLRVGYRGQPLLRYVYRPWDAPVEAPRPYFHPLHTLGGDEVTVHRPHDHVWHKGLAFSLPNVDPAGGEERAGEPGGSGHTSTANFWGGPTYRRGRGYVLLDNVGAMRHRSFATLDSSPDAVRVVHHLDWVTAQGEIWFVERRTFRVAVTGDAWTLAFETSLTNVGDADVAIGSPTTEGRDNAGYGGLFWRGPRSFTGGKVYADSAAPGAAATGGAAIGAAAGGGFVAGGDELMGARGSWLAFCGQHDGHGRRSTLVFVDGPDNAGHPTRWFVRSTPFAAVCPAPFFAEEVPLAAGGTLALRYAVVVADGDPGPDGAASLAATGLSALEGR